MKIKKIFLLSALCLCLCKVGFSENPDTAGYAYRYELWGSGFKQQKISFLSPLFYEGISFVGSSGKTSFRNGKLTSSGAEFYADVFLKPHSGNSIIPYNYMLVAMGADYAYNKYYLLPNKVNAKISPTFFVGLGYWLDFLMTMKYNNTNNPLYFHFNNMACLTFAATGKIKSVHIFNEFSVPVAGVYLGSEYSSSLPYFVREEEDANFFDAFDILFINKNLHLKNTLNADFKLKFKRRYTTVRLQYVLNARQLRLNNNELTNICHIFKIGYLFNANEIPYVHK